MKITIINHERKEKRYTREELDAFVAQLQDIMKRLAELFPTFTITKGTDMELGRRLIRMGYKGTRRAKGSAFYVQEKPSHVTKTSCFGVKKVVRRTEKPVPTTPKQLVLVAV